jgi:hypothetical protein
MTNDNIIEMVTGKVSTGVIISQIRASKTAFVLTKDEVIRLTKAGVPALVIEVMRDPAHAPVSSVEAAAKKAPAPTTAGKQTVAPAPVVVPPPVATPQNTAKTATTAPAVVPAPAPVAPAKPAVSVNIADAIPFYVKLAEDVPADAEEGRPLHFTVVDGLKVGDTVVIAKGATVTGSIVDAAGKKNIFGGGGKMTFQLTQADGVDGKKLHVRAESGRGKNGPAKRPIDSGAKGKTKEIAAASGSQYLCYTDGDQSVSVRK